jgi:hypothetical protein
MAWFRRSKQQPQEAGESSLAYPYYVDSAGLRVLADSLGIDLPLARQTGADSRVSVSPRGVGGERGWSETTHSEGHIHLNHLAARLRRSAAYKDVVDVLGFIPLVNDSSVLHSAISHIQSTPADDEQANDLLRRLQTAYDLERARTIAAAKREELEQVATQNQLVILRGTFDALISTEDNDAGVRVRLTHLEASNVPYKTSTDPPAEKPAADAPEMQMPEGVGIEAVLPARDALTAAGQERLTRGKPFYGG